MSDKNSDKQNFKITKISTHSFLTLLESLYASGADFFDIYAEIDEVGKQDNVIIATPEKYYNEDSANSHDIEELEEDVMDDIEPEEFDSNEGKENVEIVAFSDEYISNLLKNV